MMAPRFMSDRPPPAHGICGQLTPASGRAWNMVQPDAVKSHGMPGAGGLGEGVVSVETSLYCVLRPTSPFIPGQFDHVPTEFFSAGSLK